MPAVRGDGMRGLAVFISDIRNCKCKRFYFYYNLTSDLNLKYPVKRIMVQMLHSYITLQ